MIARRQPLQNCQSPENDEQSSELNQESFEQQVLQELQNLPTLEQYLSNQHQILNRDELTLKQLCHLKNKAELQDLRKSMSAYFSLQSSKGPEQKLLRKNRGQISSQFILNLRKVPSHSIIYVSVKEISGNRCHMIARNHRGECLAYFERQRKCKKLSKILNILKQIRKPMMVVIIDQTAQTQANIPEIKKVQNYASEFLYIFENAEHISINFDSNELRSNKNTSKPDKTDIHLTNKELIISSPNITAISDTQIMEMLVSTSKTHQQEQAQALLSVCGYVPEEYRNISLEFIFINVLRAWKCTSTEAIPIIQRLFNKQQQIFNSIELMKREKQMERDQKKDPDSHFPQAMGQWKVCLRCKLAKRANQKKKTQVKCEGCSVIFKKDIPLCPLCFSEFHQNYEFFASQIQKSLSKSRLRLKRSVKLSKGQNESISQEKNLTSSEKMVEIEVKQESGQGIPREQFPEEVNEKILRLNALFTDTFERVNRLRQMGCNDVAKLFLGQCFRFSLDKMKYISENYPKLNTGVTYLAPKIVEELKQIPKNLAPPQRNRVHESSSDDEKQSKKQQNFE